MTFPLVVGDRTFDTAVDLAKAVLIDARHGGGLVVRGRVPHQWLLDVVSDGRLPRDLAAGLAAALIKTRDPGPVCEGARFAAALQDPSLHPLLGVALEGQPLDVVCRPDPLVPAQTVEETLLRAWAAVAGALDAAARGKLLMRLRHAALADVEMRVLALHGSPREIRVLLPGVLVEGLPKGGTLALVQGLERGGDATAALAEVMRGAHVTGALPDGGDVAEALIEAAPDLPAEIREQVWAEAVASMPAMDDRWFLKSKFFETPGR